MKNSLLRYGLTGVIVLVAAGALFLKYRSYVSNPWTRDGQVRANVIQVTPRVSGPLTSLPIQDNQFVSAQDVLFEIDPRTYEAALEQARADLDQTRVNLVTMKKQVDEMRASVDVARAALQQAESAIKQTEAEIVKNNAELERQKELLPQKATSDRAVQRAQANYDVSLQKKLGAAAGLVEAEASVVQAQAAVAEAQAKLGAPGEANAQIRAAMASVRQAELDLEFTTVRAPVEGYVTNLNLRLGTQAIANQAALALVDTHSFWVHGFFKETSIAGMEPGDEAVVTLMAYPDSPISGRVDSLGWGIAQQDGSTGFELLPNVSPTFEWIRLAQRVPVRVHLLEIPEEVELRVGTTASVLVRKDRRAPAPPEAKP